MAPPRIVAEDAQEILGERRADGAERRRADEHELRPAEKKGRESSRPSRMKTYAPPSPGTPRQLGQRERAAQGEQPAGDPHDMSGSGPGKLVGDPAGERKIPEPMVEPMSTATALQSPSCRFRGIRAVVEVAMGWSRSVALPYPVAGSEYRSWDWHTDHRRARRSLDRASGPICHFATDYSLLAQGVVRSSTRFDFPSAPSDAHLLADGLFWLSVACCAIAQFFIIRSVRRAGVPNRRRSAAGAADGGRVGRPARLSAWPSCSTSPGAPCRPNRPRPACELSRCVAIPTASFASPARTSCSAQSSASPAPGWAVATTGPSVTAVFSAAEPARPIIEVSHRYLASILLLSLIAPFVGWRRRERAWRGRTRGVLRSRARRRTRRLGALLGAVTVKLGNAPFATLAHWTVAMSLVATPSRR